MSELMALLTSLFPGKKLEDATDLVDSGTLDSLDIVSIVSEITRAYDIDVPPEEIVPENFNSVAGMLAMIERLEDQ